VGHWERGAMGKVGYREKGLTRKEVWGHQEWEVTGKEGYTWKRGSLLKEALKERWVTGKRKVIGKCGFTIKG